MIAASYKPKKKFMQLAIAEAKRARDRGDYPIGAVVTRVTEGREVVIASAGNRVKTSGSSIKHVELETLKYVSSGYGRYLTEFVLYTTHEPCAMCAGASVGRKFPERKSRAKAAKALQEAQEAQLGSGSKEDRDSSDAERSRQCLGQRMRGPWAIHAIADSPRLDPFASGGDGRLTKINPPRSPLLSAGFGFLLPVFEHPH